MNLTWSPGPVLVAGPCVLEGDALNLRIGETLAELGERLSIPVVYKASFDKANRSNPDAPRGPRLNRGLEQLARVREMTGLPVLTDVHEVDQVAAAGSVCDALQIPAFLCRQTDLLIEAGRVGKPVNIKKGQWISPAAMAGAVAKVQRGGGGGGGSLEIAVTERGTFFGYRDLVVDMRNFASIRRHAGVPVIFDATHSVQQPSGRPDGSSGGDRTYVRPLLLAAAAAGADGFFMETHPDPDRAPCDGDTMVPLAEMESLVGDAVAIWRQVRERSPAGV